MQGCSTWQMSGLPWPARKNSGIDEPISFESPLGLLLFVAEVMDGGANQASVSVQFLSWESAVLQPSRRNADCSTSLFP